MFRLKKAISADNFLNCVYHTSVLVYEYIRLLLRKDYCRFRER